MERSPGRSRSGHEMRSGKGPSEKKIMVEEDVASLQCQRGKSRKEVVAWVWTRFGEGVGVSICVGEKSKATG